MESWWTHKVATATITTKFTTTSIQVFFLYSHGDLGKKETNIQEGLKCYFKARFYSIEMTNVKSFA